jgi:hypothetical protein
LPRRPLQCTTSTHTGHDLGLKVELFLLLLLLHSLLRVLDLKEKYLVLLGVEPLFMLLLILLERYVLRTGFFVHA